MNKNDRADFYDAMTKLFGGYGKTAAVELMEEWFEDLIDYSFFQVRGAFRAYKLENVYAPVIASIRKYANRISREASTVIQRCSNNYGRNFCGLPVFAHGHCEKCYDDKRPKNDIDSMFKKTLEELCVRANDAGYVTKAEIANFARAEMSLKPLGRMLLKNIPRAIDYSPVATVKAVPATPVLRYA